MKFNSKVFSLINLLFLRQFIQKRNWNNPFTCFKPPFPPLLIFRYMLPPPPPKKISIPFFLYSKEAKLDTLKNKLWAPKRGEGRNMVPPPPSPAPTHYLQNQKSTHQLSWSKKKQILNNNKQQSLWRNHKYRKRRFQQNYTKINMKTWWILT